MMKQSTVIWQLSQYLIIDHHRRRDSVQHHGSCFCVLAEDINYIKSANHVFECEVCGVDDDECNVICALCVICMMMFME